MNQGNFPPARDRVLGSRKTRDEALGKGNTAMCSIYTVSDLEQFVCKYYLTGKYALRDRRCRRFDLADQFTPCLSLADAQKAENAREFAKST